MGNELVKDEIKEFSQRLDIEKLYSYAEEIKKATELLLTELPFDKLKEKISANANHNLIDSKCVSDDENAVWLIDYWCGKNIKGLIQMPFSRHLIMHTEAALRIAEKLK